MKLDEVAQSWKLFLDDERFPANEDPDWKIARSVDEAKHFVKTYGPPYHIAFDHDLGDKVPSGKDFANWLVDMDLDAPGQYIHPQLTFYAHSQNPDGAKNITGLIDQYLKHRI